jgi:hypothetical protein
MGRAYAGTLGPLAFACVVARGLIAVSGVENTLATASAALFAFAIIGYIIGQLAEFLVSESVRNQFQAAMAAWDAKHGSEKTLQTKTQARTTN